MGPSAQKSPEEDRTTLYLAVDLHRKQLTVNLRNEVGEVGEVLIRRQVSTRWERVRAFLDQLQTQAGLDGYLAVMEECGFHDWLVKLLGEYGCCEVVLVQPTGRSKRKTDRRDAAALGELR